MEIVRKFDSPFFRVYADLGNLNAMEVDPREDLRTCRGNLAGVHIKDSKPGVLRDVRLGEGTLDLNACLSTLADMEYSGIFVAEMWCHENPGFHPYLKTASKYIRQALSQY